MEKGPFQSEAKPTLAQYNPILFKVNDVPCKRPSCKISI